MIFQSDPRLHGPSTSRPDIETLPFGGVFFRYPAAWMKDAGVVFVYVDGRNPANQLRLVVFPIIFPLQVLNEGKWFGSEWLSRL